ncbi:Nucleolar protein 13 [Cryomyces antarcticus]|nr:Nucleolar protein 13 [Cryomyces antarcticus]
MRKAKKGNNLSIATTGDSGTQQAQSTDGNAVDVNGVAPDATAESAVRSQYGIWIGNLPWTATKDSLRTFLTDHAKVEEDKITRIHMPPPSGPPNPRQAIKPTNKGFAYVDLTTQEVLDKVISVSETLMSGRRVLIKNAKSFEGRPEKKEDGASAGGGANGAAGVGEFKSAKPPAKRIFVGNLGFDVEKDDLIEHFTPCGEVVDVHMATFEDTGKCKGFAWVTFDALEASEAAVKGWTMRPVEKDESESGADGEDVAEEEGTKDMTSKKKAKGNKTRKWFVNRLKGRSLRCEFAEDAASRYKKRYGKVGAAGKKQDGTAVDVQEGDLAGSSAAPSPTEKKYHLTESDIASMRELRAADPRQWTRVRLAQRFECSEFFVSLCCHAPEIKKEREQQLEDIKRRWGRRKTEARQDRQRRKESWGRDE